MIGVDEMKCCGGKQVRLFLVDGTAGGLITAEIVNWTGHVLKGARDKLGVEDSTARRRPRGDDTATRVAVIEPHPGSVLLLEPKLDR